MRFSSLMSTLTGGDKRHSLPLLPSREVYAPSVIPQIEMPARGGRVSDVIQPGNLYGFLMDEMAQVTPNFELELLKLCNHLAKYNGDVSYAVDNIVQLGNTPAVISFDGKVDPAKAKQMRLYLKEAEKRIYRGGMNSLQNDLFAQVAVNGPLSAEFIPSRSLDRIEKVVLVDPYYIRFRYNPKTYEYDAYQKPPSFIGENADGLKKLNPATYRYYAYRLFNDNPYAIPSFISALESMEIEKDMLKNMRHIVRKLGLFGFLSVLLTPPVKRQNETDEAFYARAQTHLDKVRAEVEKGYAEGMSLGYKNAIEYKVEGSNTNVAGAKDFIEIITQMKSAGLKQDPLMLGRNFNVAETMARVIMAKLTTQIANFQRVVASFREDLYFTMLSMAGFNPPPITVEYAPPMIGDKLRDAQAYAADIENNINLRDRGIISQDTASTNIGYDEPHNQKDVDYSVVTAADKAANAAKGTATDPKKTKDPKQADDATADGSTGYSAGYDEDLGRMLTLEELHLNLHKGIPEYVYHVANCGCGHNGVYTYDKKKTTATRSIDDYILLYKTSIGKEYQKAVDKVALKVGEALAKLEAEATVQEVTDQIFYILYSQWGKGFTKTQKKIVERWVTDIYTYFRHETDAFPTGAKIPEVVFGLHDIRAIQYFRNSDELYLGKFITDSDTRKRITEFIKEHYLKEGRPIGNSPEAIEAFQEAFADVLRLEDWKIRRIIDTSVSTMRNSAALAYIQQTDIQSFQVLGINDGRQCAYCRHMNGMVFNVDKAYEHMDKVVNSFPALVKSDKPFVTSVFGGSEGLSNFLELSADEIQASNIDICPFHPNCRCTIIAVL